MLAWIMTSTPFFAMNRIFTSSNIRKLDEKPLKINISLIFSMIDFTISDDLLFSRICRNNSTPALSMKGNTLSSTHKRRQLRIP